MLNSFYSHILAYHKGTKTDFKDALPFHVSVGQFVRNSPQKAKIEAEERKMWCL